MPSFVPRRYRVAIPVVLCVFVLYYAFGHKLRSHASTDGHKYVYFQQHRTVGFNNLLEEVVLLWWISSLAGRSYVRSDWNSRTSALLSRKDDKVEYPWRFPATTFDAIINSTSLPPSIHDSKFFSVCPNPKTIYFGTYGVPFDGTLEEVVNGLKKEVDCVYVRTWLMDWSFRGGPDVIKNYDSIAEHIYSPLRWGDQVYNALSINKFPSHTPYLAVHVRRGDFIEHCNNLRNWGSKFAAWSVLASPSQLFTPGSPDMMERCWPTTANIVDKIRKVHKEHLDRTGQNLKGLWILTNAKSPEIQEIRSALGDLFTHFMDSRSFELAYPEERPYARYSIWQNAQLRWKAESNLIKVVADMEAGRQADAFLGHGWSSLSSNILALRLAGLHDEQRAEGQARVWFM